VHEEGIFVGMSSGAAMLAARQVTTELTETKLSAGKALLVVLFPDRGEKYLSTNLFKV